MDYVIGDIHGCAKTLRALLEKINPTEEDHLIFLGDYIDRGPDSKGVLDILIDIKTPKTLLMGNHEDMMLDVLLYNRPHSADLWLHNGGRNTLASYDNIIVKDHLLLLKDCPLIVERRGFYIAHAGIDPMNPLKCDEYYYLWDRGSSAPIDGKKLIVGHTPKCIEDIRASLSTRKIYLDNGCIFIGSKDEGYGSLVSLCLDDMSLIIQPCIDGE